MDRKGLSGVVTVMALFGAVSLLDVIVKFGTQSADVSAPLLQVYHWWVAFRNLVGHTLLPVALVLVLGRFSRLVLIPLLMVMIVVRVACAYAENAFQAHLADEWLHLLTNTNLGEIRGFVSMSCTVMASLGAVGLLLLLLMSGWLMWRARYPRICWRNAAAGVPAGGSCAWNRPVCRWRRMPVPFCRTSK